MQAGPALEIAAALADLSQDPRLAVQMAAAGVLHPVATLLKQSPPRSALMSNAIMLAWNALAASPEALLNEPRALPSDDRPGEGDPEGDWDDDEEEEEEQAAKEGDGGEPGVDSDNIPTAELEPTSSFVEMPQLQSNQNSQDAQGQLSLTLEPMSEMKQTEDQVGSSAGQQAMPGAQQDVQLIDNADVCLSNAAAGRRQPLKVRNTTSTADVASQQSNRGHGKQRSRADPPGSQNEIGARTKSHMKPGSSRSNAVREAAATQEALEPAPSGFSSLTSSKSSHLSPDPAVSPLDLQLSIAQAADVEALNAQLDAELSLDMAEETGPADNDPINLDPTELGARMRARKPSQIGQTRITGRISAEATAQQTADAGSRQVKVQDMRQQSPSKGREPASRPKSPEKRGRPLTAGTDASGASSMGRRRMVRSDSEGSGWASHSGGGVAHALADAISQLLQWAMREGRFDADRILASDAMSLALVLAQQSIGHQGESVEESSCVNRL